MFVFLTEFIYVQVQRNEKQRYSGTQTQGLLWIQ
jgi:hypothetical protein